MNDTILYRDGSPQEWAKKFGVKKSNLISKIKSLAAKGDHINLNAAELPGFNFSNVNFYGDKVTVNLGGSNFEGANFDLATMSNCFLGASFVGASLKTSTLKKSNISGADFTRANLKYADLTECRSNLRGIIEPGKPHGSYTWIQDFANFTEAILEKTSLNIVNLVEANFSKANLSGALIIGSTLIKANFTDANLSGATLLGSNCTLANFTNANLSNINLQTSDFRNADFSGANLSGTLISVISSFDQAYYDDNTKGLTDDVKRVMINKSKPKPIIPTYTNDIFDIHGKPYAFSETHKLTKATLVAKLGELQSQNIKIEFDEVFLQQADLYQAPLRKANLRKANFVGANLNLADLRKADCRGANFTDTKMEHTSLEGAFYDYKTEGLTQKQKSVMISSSPIINAKDNLPHQWAMDNFLYVDNIHTRTDELHKKGIRVDLTGAFLESFDLRDLNLSNAILVNAALKNSTLKRTNLRGANLTRSDLTDVELAETQLSGADFTGATLTNVDLYNAKFDTYTKFPAGFSPVAAGAFPEDLGGTMGRR